MQGDSREGRALKKRILITGFNKQQSTRKHHLKQQLKVVLSPYGLYNCLIDMGYDVDHREVVIGEDLSMYDDVIVHIAGPRQLVATHTYRGLWAIKQRPDCILAFDDWQVEALFTGIAKCEDPDELFHDFVMRVNNIGEIIGHQFADGATLRTLGLTDAIRTITAMKNRMLICAFDTSHLGDRQQNLTKLFGRIAYPADRLFGFNPNPYHRNRRLGNISHLGPEDPDLLTVPPEIPASPECNTKRERFNFVSLVQSRTVKWLKKLGMQDVNAPALYGWPVDMYGSKAQGQDRLTEDKMFEVFARDWGCLMPGYEHAGSGWWRARPLQVADGHSILIGDVAELEVYYGAGSKLARISAYDVVNASHVERVIMADNQREAIFRIHPLHKQKTQIELDAVLGAPR